MYDFKEGRNSMDTVIVASSQFYSHYPKRIPRGTVNAEAVLVRLDPEWEGLTVRIHWLNVASGVEKVVLLERDQPNTIPWEVLTGLGELRMGLDGMDGGTVVKPTVWLTYGYVVDGVDPESGSDPQPPTPSWEQQMVALAEAAANAAKAAKETADNLQAAAESGEFNGDPGPAGPPGKSPIIRNGTWWIWNNDSQDYTDTGVVASGGGGGVSSYNDLSDRPTIGGVLLEGNKTAQDLGLQPKGDYATTSSKLANPFSITFNGAVEAAYDGSQSVTVTIPTIAGPTGATPDIQIGTVDTLEPGSDATATITGTPESPRLNLGIPRGQNGKTPEKGIDYFTESEIQDVAKQAAELVPAGASPIILADITIGAGGANSVSESIPNVDKIASILVTITPPVDFTPSNMFIYVGSAQIGHLNALTIKENTTFAIDASLFIDAVSCIAYYSPSYMWTNKTVYVAYKKGSWVGAESISIKDFSSGGIPEGTKIRVVGK